MINLILVNPNFVSLMLNFLVGGFCMIYGYFIIRFQSLKVLSGYNEKTMPYIDKKHLSNFLGLCFINAGLVVMIPNLLATLFFKDFIMIVGVASYIFFTIILIYMIIKTNIEGKRGGKFTKREK